MLGPVAESFGADLYLPTGEISETQVHRMAVTAPQDGRPLVVLLLRRLRSGRLADGHLGRPQAAGAPCPVARKLEFDVHRVALIPDQVRELGLPSTPLKKTERRADRWQQAMGTAQTEIDALAALQPESWPPSPGRPWSRSMTAPSPPGPARLPGSGRTRRSRP